MRISLVSVATVLAAAAHAGTLKCPPDSVKVGNACIDTYEASVWQIPPSNTSLVKKVQQGKAKLSDLVSGGATQLSMSPACTPNVPTNFQYNGNWTPVLGSSPPSPGVYAVSIPGVPPSACLTWFQANQACALSGKRLVRNGEWQRAAAGTPDGAPCIVAAGAPGNTGTAGCVSSWGAFDMVGNVSEWVEDWADLADGCTNWGVVFGSDSSCFGGPGAVAIGSAAPLPESSRLVPSPTRRMRTATSASAAPASRPGSFGVVVCHWPRFE
jgi:hypothetical protein